MAAPSLRLNQETQGTVAEEGRRQIIKLPEGSEIALVGQVAEHPDMVEVTWEGQSVWIFAIDFEERTKGNARPLTKAASVGGEFQADINTGTATPTRTPRVRRFNSAGKEIF